jgi:Methylamine utilisation protein MauE.
MKYSTNRGIPRHLVSCTVNRILTKRHIIVELISAFFVLLFAYTAVNKLVTYNIFVDELSKSPYLEKYAVAIGWLIPVTELLIALMLVNRRTRIMGLFASFGIMLAFTIYIYMMLHYSHYIPCSCGGILAQMSWQQHLVFNGISCLLALAGISFSIIKPKPSL